ncbi:hypothetical protein [Crocosphaera sp.]|uniref:hypothetical protein n=1 Tax=Crocosphaera sp. TaxID=2729996 RepID=UPI002625766B|nr:hypothetical protein [Crocosphaera sp.]MDJ0582808.1 hypothetical protein [Crocosphaera sp.]
MTTLRILVDVDLLVNSPDKLCELLVLIEARRELKVDVIVIEETLQRVCKSKKIDNHIEWLSNHQLSNKIGVSSRHNIPDKESFSTNLEIAANYLEDFEYQLQIAHALSQKIDFFITDRTTNFGKFKLYVKGVKVESVDGFKKLLELPTEDIPPVNEKPANTESEEIRTQLQRNILGEHQTQKPSSKSDFKNSLYTKIIPKTWFKSNLIFYIILGIIVAIIIVFIIPLMIDLVTFKNYCPRNNNDAFISCGEKTFIQEQQGNQNINIQENAVEHFKSSEYENAVDDFELLFTRTKSPETLIYLNNTLLEAKKKTANTIAIAAPMSKRTGSAIDDERDLAKEILRGVAHAQTLVNYCFFSEDFNDFDFVRDSF